VGHVVEYQVRKAYQNGFVWVGAKDLPDVVVKVYEVLLQSRHVLARLRHDMYFKMSRCQNVGDRSR
jgi:hypothetical protein